MFTIRSKRELAEKIKGFVVEAPLIARKAQPGNFVLVRGDEHGERIPLTIADSDAEAGTITLVLQEIGKGTTKLGAFEPGQAYIDIVGPLGKNRPMPKAGETVVCVSGGLGVAPMYPQTKACHENGCKVISIIGARSKSLFFWHDEVAAVSDEVMYSTDDGSFGHHGFATQLLEGLVERGEKIDEVIAIGPVPHMRAVVNMCKKHNLPCVVSLNPIMVDGTGMCGGCRVTVGGKTQYACVDGPEFDGLEVDFEELMSRQGAYRTAEGEALKRHIEGVEEHDCKLEAQIADTEATGVVHRPTTFKEVARGYTEEEMTEQASRCLVCKKPRCVTGCPVEVNIPGFIQALQQGEFSKAASILKDKNSLPAICGRVCPQETQCEAVCVLGKKGEPVKIGRLERFVADWEAANGLITPEIAAPKHKKVAIIGCGPGGLTCAGDLAKWGYDVTIFEAFHDTGGVLRYGIPEFRLPKAIVNREVDYVRSLGVDIKLNMVVGKVFVIEELMKRDGFEAVFIGVGAGAPMFLGIPGENLIGVFSANEFLTRVNLMRAYDAKFDTPVIVGERVAVIGAGNVAMDAARVSLRLGAKTVSIVYRRSDAEIPARADEVKHARAEGVEFELLTAPVRILGDEKNRVMGMECIRMELGEPDASGRRRPVPIKGSECTFDCDMVIPALGNVANPLLTLNTEGLELNKWGNIVVDPATGLTSLPGVYAGGDIVTGSATVIEAMGAGRKAARAIDRYLTGAPVEEPIEV
jgi:glutamate synthase (NADPH/NADH) small chain